MKYCAMVLCALACGGAQRKAHEVRETPWTLSYADGSANAYRFSQAAAGAAVAFEYIPVTPEQSSTGSYSGGAPASASLPPGDPRIDELWRRVEALAADGKLHVEDRGKGTGAFRVTTPAGERSFIVEMGPAVTEFDAFVKTFRD